ncbi:MAG: hypothetical protein KAS46_04395 [Candidatus Aureabacteria bacterium]|nr:hypothetical protein [Candidatus Auribacterota bacterium]
MKIFVHFIAAVLFFLAVVPCEAVGILDASRRFEVFADDTLNAAEVVSQLGKIFAELDKLYKLNPFLEKPVRVRYAYSEDRSEFEMVYKGYRITFFSDNTPYGNSMALAKLCSTVYFMIASNLKDSVFCSGINPFPCWVYVGAARDLVFREKHGLRRDFLKIYDSGDIDFLAILVEKNPALKINDVAAGELFNYINSTKKGREVFLNYVSIIANGGSLVGAYNNSLGMIYGLPEKMIEAFIEFSRDKVEHSIFEMKFSEKDSLNQLLEIIYTDPRKLGFEEDGYLTLKQLYYVSCDNKKIKSMMVHKSVKLKGFLLRCHDRYKEVANQFDFALNAMIAGNKYLFDKEFYRANRLAKEVLGKKYQVKNAKIKMKFSDEAEDTRKTRSKIKRRRPKER